MHWDKNKLMLFKIQNKWSPPMVLFRVYSSRKKSWARESPTFPASVTAEKNQTPKQEKRSASLLQLWSWKKADQWVTPQHSRLPLMSPPAQKAFPPAPLMITMSVSASFSHFWNVKIGFWVSFKKNWEIHHTFWINALKLVCSIFLLSKCSVNQGM